MSGPVEIAATDIADAAQFLRDIAEPCLPVVLRGAVRHWPVVRAAAQSPQAFRDYVSRFDRGLEAEAFFGEPHIAGKYYYSEDLRGFNFERRQMGFGQALDAILACLDQAGSQTVYIGSLATDDYLPGFAGENVLPFLDSPSGRASGSGMPRTSRPITTRSTTWPASLPADAASRFIRRSSSAAFMSDQSTIRWPASR